MQPKSIILFFYGYILFFRRQKRKIYDYKSVLELTHNLKRLDANDPIKYDFALYRLGQNKELSKLKE